MAYLERFIEACTKVSSQNNPMIHEAFTYDLWNGPLFKNLQGLEFKNIEEFLEKVNRFIRLEGVGYKKKLLDEINHNQKPYHVAKRDGRSYRDSLNSARP